MSNRHLRILLPEGYSLQSVFAVQRPPKRGSLKTLKTFRGSNLFHSWVQAKMEAGQEGRCAANSFLNKVKLHPKLALMQGTLARGQRRACSCALHAWYCAPQSRGQETTLQASPCLVHLFTLKQVKQCLCKLPSSLSATNQPSVQPGIAGQGLSGHQLPGITCVTPVSSLTAFSADCRAHGEAFGHQPRLLRMHSHDMQDSETQPRQNLHPKWKV